MGLFGGFKKAFKTVGHGIGKVFKGGTRAVSSVYKDSKSAVSWAAKSSFSLAKDFTPAGIVGGFSSPAGIGLLGVAGILGMGALLLLRK